MNKDYSQYQDSDRHQNYRDRKREKRSQQKAMRGDRSVFLIQDSIVKRGKHAKEARGDPQDTA